MQFLPFIPCLTIMLFLLLSTSVAPSAIVSRTIVVDRGGRGNFTSLQKAIDSIPTNNNLWVLINIKAATYKEKVVIPQDKPFIILHGESRRTTTIEWSEAGSSTLSSTFILHANNFMALDITFKNSYNLILPKGPDGNRILWAPAATLYGDNASFYGCGFVGVQDTLTDMLGRHYFRTCYIEGAIDFIWGEGQSFYERSSINATTRILNGTAGFITAQGRDNVNDTSGFMFLDCTITATGPVYLGRAYRKYSRVIFRRTFMPDAVVPEGWRQWDNVNNGPTTTFSEVDCVGPGSNMAGRVKWEKTLPVNQWRQLTNVNSFLNQDAWIQKQPAIS